MRKRLRLIENGQLDSDAILDVIDFRYIDQQMLTADDSSEDEGEESSCAEHVQSVSVSRGPMDSGSALGCLLYGKLSGMSSEWAPTERAAPRCISRRDSSDRWQTE